MFVAFKALGKLVELWGEKHIQIERGEEKEVDEENEGMKGVSRRKGEIKREAGEKEGRDREKGEEEEAKEEKEEEGKEEGKKGRRSDGGRKERRYSNT